MFENTHGFLLKIAYFFTMKTYGLFYKEKLTDFFTNNLRTFLEGGGGRKSIRP